MTETVGDIVSENRHRALNPAWIEHVVGELRGTRIKDIPYGPALVASMMRDAVDIIEELARRTASPTTEGE